MMWSPRKIFPYLALLLFVAAVAWAVSFGTLEPADFTFINGTEIQTVDPAVATGQPEGRIINGVFEGLYRELPSEDNPNLYEPQPAMAESHHLSDDQLTYTFTIRKNARWSSTEPGKPGRQVTAEDFVWSWKRFLHPEIGSQYAYQLTSYVQGAYEYNAGKVEPGDPVEIELMDRKWSEQPFPQGTIVRGVVHGIISPPEPEVDENASEEEQKRTEADWLAKRVFEVEVTTDPTSSKNQGKVLLYSQEKTEFTTADGSPGPPAEDIVLCHSVLPDFKKTVWIKAKDDRTLELRLKNPTPFFLHLMAFYPLYPVNRECVESHGSPNWTKPENLVANGPFLIEFRRIRDRLRLKKNPDYWDAENVQLESIDALAVESETTQLNMYLNGQADWATTVPNSMIPEMQKQGRKDLLIAPMLTVYFYRCNVTEGPLADQRVRQALNMAIDKRAICEHVLKAGQVPATTFVPPGIAGYHPPAGFPDDVQRAKKLLAEAGYPGGKGFPRQEMLYNTLEAHQEIAEVIQQQWKKNLGVDFQPRNMEWQAYLDAVRKIDYDTARAGWIGDYPDPNTFLDMFVTGNPNNQTGWGNAKYDDLIAEAAREGEPKARMGILREAEAILMEELPILPIYFYVSVNMVRPYVDGFYTNIQDLHPLHIIRVDQQKKRLLLESGW